MSVKTENIKIGDIEIMERVRKDEGDLDGLASSIAEQGLLNPVTVMETAEGAYVLLAGVRRLKACRILGYDSIRATVLSCMEAGEQLRVEVAENEERKSFTVAERLEYAQKIKAVEQEKAKERMSDYGWLGYVRSQEMEGREIPQDRKGGGSVERRYPQKGKTADIAAKQAGFSSEVQMRRAARVARERPDLFEKVNNGEMSIWAAHKEITDANGATKKSAGRKKKAAVQEDPYKDIPRMPGQVAKAKLTDTEKKSVREIRAGIVEAEEVDISVHIPERFRPADYEEHELLLKNSIYAALYEHDRQAMAAANLLRGELETRCENYEKRIRAYEENVRSMQMRISQLEENGQAEVKDDGSQ